MCGEVNRGSSRKCESEPEQGASVVACQVTREAEHPTHGQAEARVRPRGGPNPPGLENPGMSRVKGEKPGQSNP